MSRTYETNTLQPEKSTDYAFWQTPRQCVWDALVALPTLDSMVLLGRGIEYTHALQSHVSETRLLGYEPGVSEVQFLEPYIVGDIRYLSLDPAEVKENTLQLSWSSPKVLLNRARVSIDIWCLAGAVERTGLYATRQFYGVWPTGEMPVEALTAILNGPVASAFVFDHSAGIDNYLSLLKQIPMPNLTQEQTDLIVSLVNEYRACREWLRQEPGRAMALEPRCRDLLLQIDAAVLEAYDLTAELEAQLLQVFEGVERPMLPFALTGYGEDFAKAKQVVAAKRAWNHLITRYHALVDKEFESGLTPDEEAEQERLSNEIDAEEARENERIRAGLSRSLK